jgi:hypothetical protein
MNEAMVATRAVLLVPALTAALLLTGCGGVDRGHYVGRNRAIFQSLPVFPRAVKAHEYSIPDDANGEFADPTGYTTTFVYRVPPGTRGAAVLRFCETQLERRGWRLTFRAKRIKRTPIANFTRAGALVALNADLLAPPRVQYPHWTYEISVDYRGG